MDFFFWGGGGGGGVGGGEGHHKIRLYLGDIWFKQYLFR